MFQDKPNQSSRSWNMPHSTTLLYRTVLLPILTLPLSGYECPKTYVLASGVPEQSPAHYCQRAHHGSYKSDTPRGTGCPPQGLPPRPHYEGLAHGGCALQHWSSFCPAETKTSSPSRHCCLWTLMIYLFLFCVNVCVCVCHSFRRPTE